MISEVFEYIEYAPAVESLLQAQSHFLIYMIKYDVSVLLDLNI